MRSEARRTKPRDSSRRSSGKGGAYALAGFTYQLLGSLDYAASVIIQDVRGDGDDLSNVTLTLEPSKGADAAHERPGLREVIQFKRRSSAMTDTVVLSEVLPDLVRAFEPGVDRYVLRTNAVVRLSPALRAFLERVPTLGLEGAVAGVEAEGLRLRAGRRGVSPTAFLEWLMARVRSDPPANDEKACLEAVLSRFVVEIEDEAEVEDRVLRALTMIAPDPAGAGVLRMTLMGQLIDIARQGDQTRTIAGLLEACGLPVAALATTVQVAARLRAGLGLSLGRLRYETGRDGRASPLGLPGPDPTAFSGPSGVGKTWALARAAHEAESGGALVLWIDQPPETMHALAQMIASRLQAARGHTQAVIADGVDTLVWTISGQGPRLRACVCLDRLANPKAATDILTASWWREQGVEVIAALPAADPDAINLGETVTTIPVPEFSQRELRRVLKAAGVSWATLADDVRELLRRPSLASLYIGLGRPQFQPENEYVLMEAAWTWLPLGDAAAWRRAHDRVEHRLDQMIEAVLAGQMPQYPWDPDATPAFTADQIERLERHGFVKWSIGGCLALDHDRLLAWGLAGALARRFQSGQVSLTDLAGLLEVWGTGGDGESILPRHATGYAPMDLLWMLTPASGPLGPATDALIQALHPGRRHLEWGAIATLGARAQVIGTAAALHWSVDSWWHPSGVKAALIGSEGSRLPEPVVQAMLSLLTGTDSDRCALAVNVFNARPDPRALWPLIRVHAAVDFSDEALRSYTSQQISRAHSAYDAALEIVTAFPKALLKIARRRLSPAQLRTVSWLCSELPPSAARRAWAVVGPQVAATLDAGVRRRASKRMLAIFNPGLLTDSFGSADDDGHLWDAQACVDPDAALARLEAADPSQVESWLPHFSALVRQRPAAQRVVVMALQHGRLRSGRLIGALSEWAAFVSGDTWSSLIAARDPDWLAERRGQLLLRLSEVISLPLLDTLEGLRGGPVEAEVEACARQELETHTGRDAGPHLGSTSEVLLRIGGLGFDRLTAARLRSANPIDNRQGVKDVLLTTSRDPIAALIQAVEKAFVEKGSLDRSALQALAFMDPSAAAALGYQWLKGRTKLGGMAAGEIALLASDAELASAALQDLRRRPGEASLVLRSRLLVRFRLDDRALRRAADRHLAAKTSEGRAWALLIAENTGDLPLRARVAEAVLPHVVRADRDDAATIGALCEDPAFAAGLLASLKASGGTRFLRRVLGELPPSAGAIGDEMLADQAIGDALRFEDKFLNTPREGQERLWALDPEIAFEVFREGLRRGGRISEGLASGAVRADEALAIPILIEGLKMVSKPELRDEIAMALRLCSDVSAAEAGVLALVEDEAAGCRLPGLQAAGWLATPALAKSIVEVMRTDPRSRVYAAACAAAHQVDRLQVMEAVAVRASGAGPVDRRRLVAVLAGAEDAAVLRYPEDPVRRALNDLDLHAFEVLRSRFKR